MTHHVKTCLPGGFLVLTLAPGVARMAKDCRMDQNSYMGVFYGEYNGFLKNVPSMVLPLHIWNVKRTFFMNNWHIWQFLVAMETISWLHMGSVSPSLLKMTSVIQNRKQTLKIPPRTRFILESLHLLGYLSIKLIFLPLLAFI